MKLRQETKVGALRSLFSIGHAGGELKVAKCHHELASQPA